MKAATTSVALVVGFLLTARVIRPGGSRGQEGKSARFPRRHAAKPSATEWAAFLDTTSTEVRSGSSLIAALAHARIRHPSLSKHLESANGTDPDLAIVSQSVAAVLELGGPVAATLHHGAALLRERAAQRAEATAHSAQARLSARVLTAVPLAFTVWSAASSSTFRHAITSPTGLAAASAGLTSNAIGWWWMRRIVDKAMP